jgi:hypothetical protein
MSYTIEYKGEVYKDTQTGMSEPSYLLIITAGDNNVYEASNRRRARSTYIVAYGWTYNIIADICKYAGACEGGGLQPHNKYCTPEDYLKKYRNKIRLAPNINEFFLQGKKARFKIKNTLTPDDWGFDYYAKYAEYIREEPDHYEPEKIEKWCEVNLVNREEFQKFRDLWSIAKYHDSVVLLPGDGIRLREDEVIVEEKETESETPKQLSLETFGED